MNEEHQHGADTCDDPSCTLQHHNHEHHHEHDEDTCDDPGCTLHHHHEHDEHDEHEELLEDSLIMSCTRTFNLAQPELPTALQEKGMRTFLRLGDMLAFEGVVVGHIKGVITTEGGGLAFSLTRTGVVDLTELGGWKNLGSIAAYIMTVNIMSLVHAEITEEDIFALMA